MFPACYGPCVARSAQIQNQRQSEEKIRHVKYCKNIRFNNQHIPRTIEGVVKWISKSEPEKHVQF